MHDTSSFNNTMMGDHTPLHYLQGIRDKQTSPTKSPTFRNQQPFQAVERVPIKQKEFVLHPEEKNNSPRKSNLSDLEAQSLIMRRRSPVPPKKKVSPHIHHQPSDLSIIVRSNSQQEIVLESQNFAYEGM